MNLATAAKAIVIGLLALVLLVPVLMIQGLISERQARRKLLLLDGAGQLNDLRRPPSNRLEALKGDRKGQHSIRINDQWKPKVTQLQDRAEQPWNEQQVLDRFKSLMKKDESIQRLTLKK